MHIGYVGLGAMGGALARNIVGAQTLSVYDISSDAVAEFKQRGASAASSIAELAQRCDVVVLCLPRSAVVREVVFGPGGLAEGLSAGKLIIDQTSGAPNETSAMGQELAKRGILMIDAPVAGGVPAAQAGQILVMASGPDDAYDRAVPVLQAISPNIVRCGRRLGDGHAMKLVNNAINAACRLSMLEIASTGLKFGLPLRAMTDFFNSGRGQSRLTKVVLPAIIDKRSTSQFALTLMLKDLNQALALGIEHGVPMPLSNISRGLLQIGVNILGESAQLDDVIGLIGSLSATKIEQNSDGDQSTIPAPAEPQRHLRALDGALMACNWIATLECVAMGFKFGLTIEAMSAALNKGSGWNDATARALPVLASGRSTIDDQFAGVLRDLRESADMAVSCSTPMLFANAARSIMESAGNKYGVNATLDKLTHLFEDVSGIHFTGDLT